MLQFSMVDGTRTWFGSNGVLQYWTPAPHIFLSRFQGKLFDADFARQLVAACEQHVDRVERPDFLHDWELMESYETESRTLLTNQAMRISPRVNSFTVYSKSVMVQLGVSMASMLMDGRVKMVSSRVAFDAAMQVARDRKDLMGQNGMPGLRAAAGIAGR
jgi:hypothetical protein